MDGLLGLLREIASITLCEPRDFVIPRRAAVRESEVAAAVRLRHTQPRSSRHSRKRARVQIDIDTAAEDADHLIDAEERFQLAVARQ